MKEKKFISIIIPCYNVEEYIARCYESLVSQKNADDVEFIFINDGSKDNTLSILQKIKTNDNRVVLINQDNQGVSAARNNALNIIRGEFVYLLDGDDYLPDKVIDTLKSIVSIYQPEVIVPAYNISKNGIETFVPFSIEEGLYDKYELFKKIDNFPTANQLIYRSDIIHRYKLSFDVKIKCGEVYAFTINYFKYINFVYILNKPCFNYFQRSNSATHSINYFNDVSVRYAIDSLYIHGKDLVGYGSFVVTAFKLWIYFTYLKYAHFKYTKEAEEAIVCMLSCNMIKKNIKDIILVKHDSIKNRILAMYIYLMPKRLGFLLLNHLLMCRSKLFYKKKMGNDKS